MWTQVLPSLQESYSFFKCLHFIFPRFLLFFQTLIWQSFYLSYLPFGQISVYISIYDRKSIGNYFVCWQHYIIVIIINNSSRSVNQWVLICGAATIIQKPLEDTPELLNNRLCCPISLLQEEMKKPVRNKICGHTYEEEAILEHIRHRQQRKKKVK